MTNAGTDISTQPRLFNELLNVAIHRGLILLGPSAREERD